MSEQALGPSRQRTQESAAPERQTLLAVRQRQLKPNRFPLHRLLVVARLGEGVSAATVAGYYRELFENILEEPSGEDISGLLLLHPSCIFHLVESCSSTIHLIIQDLASLQSQGHSALLQDIKVLVVAHNIPTRLCPDWYAATTTAAVPRPRGSAPAESTAEVVAECLALLPQMAACIQSSEDDSEDMNESLHTLAPELLIPAETVDYLCHAEECSSPEDFLRMYLSPIQVVLDSETVWPVPSHLFA